MELLLAYIVVGWLVATVCDFRHHLDLVHYTRCFLLWPGLVIALAICWVHDIWVES